MKQAGTHVVAGCDGPQAATGLVALRRDAELLVHAPATPTLAGVYDLNRAVEHRFKVDLNVRFEVLASPHHPLHTTTVVTGRMR